jgi:hypothetical protein
MRGPASVKSYSPGPELHVAIVGADVEVALAGTFLELFSFWPELRTLHLDFVGPQVPASLHGQSVQFTVTPGAEPCRAAIKEGSFRYQSIESARPITPRGMTSLRCNDNFMKHFCATASVIVGRAMATACFMSSCTTSLLCLILFGADF